MEVEQVTIIDAELELIPELKPVNTLEKVIKAVGFDDSVDREDIVNLFQNKMFTVEDFIETAEEAKSYYGVAIDKLEFNISMAIEFLKEAAQ